MTEIISLKELLARLEYDSSPFYREDASQLNPEVAHVFRSVSGKGVKGVYVFQTSSVKLSDNPYEKPAVFIAIANNENDAKEIHRSLWNSGQAPIIIILLSNRIKIYSGFNYSPNPNEERGLLENEPILEHTADRVARILSLFSASAIDSGNLWRTKEYLEVIQSQSRVDSRLLANLLLLQREVGQSIAGTERLLGGRPG